MRIKLTRQLTKEETDVALSIGARDLKDFVCLRSLDIKELFSKGTGHMPPEEPLTYEEVLDELLFSDARLWLFEEIEG